jgi:thiamine biosynthesis lipoprotein
LEEFGIEFGAMASRNEIRLFAPDESTARRWAQAAIDEVRRIEFKFSRYRDDSVISAINRAAGGAAVAVDDETAALLDFGAQLHRDSGGLFDLTSGVLRRAWDFKAARVPSQADIDAILPLIGWQCVEWIRPHLRLPRAGSEIDFGGIGKEYAADRAAGVLTALGARHGFVNLGGDMRGVGARPGGEPWSIAIQHPRVLDRFVGTLDIDTGAVATSGDYERFFEADGRRYCHILNPCSGWPEVHWQSVSVAAPVCVAAGACSTIAMLMPREPALAFLGRQGLAWLAVDSHGCVSNHRPG